MRSILKTALLVAVVAMLAVGLADTTQGGKKATDFEPGGTWLSELRARITEKLDDANTAAALMAEIDRIEAELTAFDAAVIEHYKNLDQLDRNYETRRADYEAAIMKFNTERMAVRDRIVVIRFRMRNHTTPDQWKIVADIDTSLLQEFQRTYSL